MSIVSKSIAGLDEEVLWGSAIASNKSLSLGEAARCSLANFAKRRMFRWIVIAASSSAPIFSRSTCNKVL